MERKEFSNNAVLRSPTKHRQQTRSNRFVNLQQQPSKYARPSSTEIV
jgi:hypothetical protein